MTQTPDASPANPNYRDEVERILQASPCSPGLGLEAGQIAAGLCLTSRCGPESV